MRASNQALFRRIACSCIAAGVLALTSIARGQTDNAPSNAAAAPARPSQMVFKTFVVKDDPQHTGMVVTHGLIPADWTFQGGVVWHLAQARPMQLRYHFSDAQGVSAIDVYPDHFFYFSRQDARRGGTQGNLYLGRIIEKPPQDIFQAFNQVVVARDRPDLAQAHVVKQEKLPEVAKRVFATMPQNPDFVKLAAAGRVTYEYELNGQTVQEEFFIVYQQAASPKLGFIQWQVINVRSTRAPKGSLDQLKALNVMLGQTCQPNLAFFTKVSNFILNRQKMIREQQIQNGQAILQQAQLQQSLQSAPSEAGPDDQQAYEQHMKDIDDQSDKEADGQREVLPWKDEDGTVYKLPAQYGIAWESNDGRVLMPEDPRDDPNTDLSLHPATWTRMVQEGN